MKAPAGLSTNTIISHAPPRRVLIIKPSAIGDVVHALPVLPRLRKLWPEAKLTWLITPACAGLVERHPLIDDVIRFERNRWARGWYNPAALAGMLKFLLELRERQFDLVIDLQGLGRSGLMALTTGARRRIGFANARELSRNAYTERVECSWTKDHAVQRYLKIASALGCGTGPVEFQFAVDDEDRRYIDSHIPASTPYAVLMPGTNWETKRWPAERFAELIEPLKRQFGLESVLAGSRSDMHLARSIPARFNMVGKTNLRQIVALLERAKLVIGNDTGPMHIAAALDVPLVAPYGPTDPVKTGPFGRMESVVRLGLPCSPCYSRTCSHCSCMNWLDTRRILKTAAEQISKRPPVTTSLNSANY